MVDLRIWILTHPASTWDVEALKKDCLTAFVGEDLVVEVCVQSNTHPGEEALPARRYISQAVVAQWHVGNNRLAKSFSILTLMWHLRQLAGLVTSLMRLISRKHREKVTAESVRAARIAKGHAQMWQRASTDPAKLNLFLEDDVILKEPKLLAQLTKSLQKIGKTDQFICDCSHSYSMSELGIDVKHASVDPNRTGLQRFDFPYTNTLAANFASPALVQLTAQALAGGRSGKGLGIDLDLMHLWSVGGFEVHGMAARVPIFEQQSGFRIQKI